jgi:hypothetical protein
VAAVTAPPAQADNTFWGFFGYLKDGYGLAAASLI